jgi:electron transfer flavoprotein alpha subunit
VRSTVVFVEVAPDEGVTRTSLEALTLGRDLAAGTGTPLVAVTIGEEVAGADAPLAADVGAYGAVRSVALTHGSLSPDVYAPGRWGAALAAAVEELDADAVVVPGSERGTEVLAHVGARLDLPMTANCTSIEAATVDGHSGATWRLTRLRWGGVLLEDAELAADRALVTVAAHHVVPTPVSEPVSASAEALAVHLDDQDPLLAPQVVEHAAATGGVGLATARVVVSGGRGVGSAEGFAPLEELAQLLGGAVGCSRVVTNAGWRSHNDQVGQTGTRVAPDLYIACGISGATQHWVGCMNSKRILAINTDPEAPMVTRAHDAVIADVQEVLRAVLQEVRTRTGSPV